MHLVNPPPNPFDVFITRDPIVGRIVQRLQTWARDAADGLITGESGVGKSFAAHVLHMASGLARAPLAECRANEPLGVAHSWATLDEHGGFLVLDGLEHWPLDEQAEIVGRLEARREAAPRIQLLGTSRLPLSRLQIEARLHPALGRRFDSRAVHLPPLRTRPDDLAPLVQLMLRRCGRASVRLTPEAWRALADHGWPDNVRELRQVVDSTLASATTEQLDARHLALDPLAPPALEAMADKPFDDVRREVDAWYLRRLLHHTDGNLSEAARRAGCSRKVLRDRLRRHGLYTPPPLPTCPTCLCSTAREPAADPFTPWADLPNMPGAMVARERVVSPLAWGQRRPRGSRRRPGGRWRVGPGSAAA
ncbi:MAG: sigma 54-interacting transcriptional regulator [Myxococcota bacterium]